MQRIRLLGPNTFGILEHMSGNGDHHCSKVSKEFQMQAIRVVSLRGNQKDDVIYGHDHRAI